MIGTLPTLAERRDQIVHDTQEQLELLTQLINGTMLPSFPAAANMYQDSMQGNKRGSIRQRLFITPFFVLPAREVRSCNEKSEPITRRIAAYMMIGYKYPASEDKKIVECINSANMPVPDSICIPVPHPVALQADIDAGEELYVYDNRSISGTRLNLLPWVVDTRDFGTLPHRALPSQDESFDFDIFKQYPPEAMDTKAYAIDFHQQRVDRFKDFAANLALALNNPSLNPPSA